MGNHHSSKGVSSSSSSSSSSSPAVIVVNSKQQQQQPHHHHHHHHHLPLPSSSTASPVVPLPPLPHQVSSSIATSSKVVATFQAPAITSTAAACPSSASSSSYTHSLKQTEDQHKSLPIHTSSSSPSSASCLPVPTIPLSPSAHNDKQPVSGRLSGRKVSASPSPAVDPIVRPHASTMTTTLPSSIMGSTMTMTMTTQMSSNLAASNSSLSVAAIDLSDNVSRLNTDHHMSDVLAQAYASGVSPALAARSVTHNSSVSHRTSIAQYIDAERRHAQEQQYHLYKKRQHQLHTQNGLYSELHDLSVVYLPRGGIYVHTPAGPVQFGMPPETIKDSMKLGLSLPVFFVVPKDRFNLSAGINVAEFEFPAYYNFFFKRRRINLICTPAVEPLIRTIFTETLVGPSAVEWPTEYGENVPRSCYPNLSAEMSFFSINPFDKTPLTVDSLLDFKHFDSEGKVYLDNGVCIRDEGEEYLVTVTVKQEGKEEVTVKELARVTQEVLCTPLLDGATLGGRGSAHQSRIAPGHPPASLQSPSASDVVSSSSGPLPVSSEYFVPPHFGLTMLGNSDGFDSSGTTTGFVLWMNRRGIMVDPPPHSGALLKRHGISGRLMRGVILTHCHADHDAGTFQKILEEGKVVLMTTEVILDSFLRKYSAISGLDAAFLRKLFVFRPVLVGQRTAVYGGHVEFFYSLHSIPCVGFSAYCNGKSMVYSADSFNDPVGINKLYQQGLLSEGRRDKLLNFPWHHDLILHEAGVPPIHTPLATLESLPADVKERLYIVHKPPNDVPKDKGLKSALVGPANTLVISDVPPMNATALEVLDLLCTIDMFSGFDLSRAMEILTCASYLQFSAGEVLIAEGSFGSTLYVIAMGTVSVSVDGSDIKQLTVGDHFGEMGIITGEKRTASIKALTPVEVIQFSKQEFLYIVRNTDAIQRLQQLGVIQRSPSWQVITANSSLSQLSSAQKTYLQSLFQHRIISQGDVLWRAGDLATEALLIADGSVYFSRASDAPPFTRGALIGEMRPLINNTILTTTLLCSESGSVYAISRVQLNKFLDDNPGVKVQFMNRRFIE